MIPCLATSPIKGVRVPRRKGDGEGSLRQRMEAGRRVWVGRWVYYTPDGIQKRPERIIGDVKQFPSKLKAREEFNRIMQEMSGKLAKMPEAPTFKQVWERFLAINKPLWSKAHVGSVVPIIERAVLPIIGDRDIAALTPEPLQGVLNRMVEMPLLLGVQNKYTRIGYGETALKRARTYMHSVFDFAIEEGLIGRNPARKLRLPETRKSCERYLSIEEVQRLLAAATGRERLTLRLLMVGGLRPAELFALKTDDIRPGSLRIDEAVKERERQATGKRIGKTKTDESDGSVAISAELEAELRAWASTRTGSLMFPTDKGTTWRIGNYLKRVLKPLAKSVGIDDLTFQCLRRTCATHFGGTVKDAQTQLRHTDPAVTLRHYKKAIPESQRAAVELMDALFMQQPETGGRVN